MVLRKRRKSKFSQRQLAAKVGCSQPYLAQVETGVRPISKRIAEKLEVVFKVKRGTYTKAVFPRGRPPRGAEARQALRQIGLATGKAPRALESVGPPTHPRADRVFGLENQFWPIGPHLGAEAARQVRQLEALRPREEHFWRHLNGIPYDSWTEKLFQVGVGLSGAELTRVSLGSLGCELPSADGLTGRDSRKRPYPAFVTQQGDMAVAMFPQRCVGTAHGYRWPDTLVVAARDGRKITAVVELDGAPFHGNRDAERRRDRDLGVDVLHVDASEVGKPGLLKKIFDWLGGLLG
ncbi:MAG: helix-turn-helix transcriptional regulator [Gammaproteobacteria bacterium]|nr:helix-turn-helix transcriptional regulator [Gammaproteobacteria bacterium]